MKWDCMIKLEGLQNPIVVVTSPMYNLPSFELTPLTQIQSLHLYVAQLASGEVFIHLTQLKIMKIG